MVELDQTLLADARRLRHGANVHNVNTLIFCYQEAILAEHEGRPYRASFERSLRDFVSQALLIERARRRAARGLVKM
jgi:hypothetical protein